MPQREQQQVEGAGPLNFFTEPGAVTIEAAATATDGKEGSQPIPRFSMVAYTGGAMKVAGWRYPVILDLAGLAIPSQSRPIRFNHDPASGVGHSDSIRVADGQLLATGLISRDTGAAREIVTSAKNKFPWQASVGANVDQFEFVKDNQQVLVNGRQFAGPVNVVRKATLGEISFVDLGADGNTSASVAAKAKENKVMDDNGNPSTITTEQDTTTGQAAAGADGKDAGKAQADGARAAGKDADPSRPSAPAVQAAAVTAQTDSAIVADPVADMRTRAAAEQERIAALRKVCGDDHADICARAIRDGWDVTRTELEVLRNSRPEVPPVHMVDNSLSDNVLEAACVLTAGLAKPERMYDEQTLDAADKRFRGGIGLQELLLEAAWANGYTGRTFRDSRSVLRFAFASSVQAAGLSTIDISGILSNVSNKFLLDGFFSVERVWRNICSVRSVSDFKAVESYRLIGRDQYELVAPGGEIKSGTLGQEKYTNKADTYGLILDIDRRDIINDDLGAITTVPRKLGRGSGLKINDVFWKTFLGNAAFFTAGNKNLITGADTTLGIDSMSKAEKAFMDQVDSDGKPLGAIPTILLLPTALSAMGTQLYKSLEVRDTTVDKKTLTANPHQGKFRAEVSRYLSNSNYPGHSDKAWYLLAGPELPVIEVAFLNGQESPTIETADADFNTLGLRMRGFHDWGIGLQDPKGGCKVTGEAA